MKRFACLAIPLALAACGDNQKTVGDIDAPPAPIDGPTIDTPTPIDAPNIDAPPDGPPPVTFSGTVSVLESKVLNPGTSGTFFGQGVQVGVTFTASDQVPAPLMETIPGSPLGCKAWVYTATQAVASSVGVDVGPVQVNSPAGSGTALYPGCGYQAGAGYLCPETATAGAGGTIGAGPQAGLATLTVSGTPYTAANTTNRYVRISGATNAANNGAFPIVALASPSTIVYANPAFVAETMPAAASRINLAGVGPTPSAPNPGFLADDATMDFVHAAGPNVGAFTATTMPASVGNDFTLTTTELNKLNALPRGGEFTVTCALADCPAGSASGTLINIVTTDAPTAGLSPFAMPFPVTERVQVRCAALGSNAVTVPAAYAALLNRAGITRIQTTLIRPQLMAADPATTPVTAISGHAIVGFTNVP